MGFNAINIKKAAEVTRICNSGKLQIGSKTLDITDKLKMSESTEYRKEQMDAIDVSKFSEAGAECVYSVTAYGADEAPFYNRDDKVCVLNFASSKHPGGGFESGAMAQEEALCHASNLNQCLKKHNSFYEYNIANLRKSQYSDGIIYTKDAVFFRKKFNNTNPKMADVITCAAPNWGASRRLGVTLNENNKTMSRRLEQILKVAIANGNRKLVLGAFGCGVFKNEPEYVASELFRLLKTEGYEKYFSEIIFAMNDNKGINFRTFKDTFCVKKVNK